jgi:glycosyltransferase involved in cell wall biosynthesis
MIYNRFSTSSFLESTENEKKIKITYQSIKMKKQSNKFIYSSRPERGLDKLLQLWPQIVDEMPDAELVISNYGIEPDPALMDIIKKYDNIKYLGKLNTEQLYSEMSSAEYWLYPTTWPETSCITGMEMLMSEVICLYYPIAGLINTVGKYGIQVKSGNEIETIVSLTNKQKKLQITIPKLEHFLHRTLIECARLFWTNTFLFSIFK